RGTFFEDEIAGRFAIDFVAVMAITRAEVRFAELAEDVLEARAMAIFAVAERVEQPHERFGDAPDETGRHERLELDRGLRRVGKAPRRDDAEPRDVVADGGDETQI